MKIDPLVLPKPSEPYCGISPFRLLDWRIFFEREVETERLTNLVSLYRGVLLYGRSGAGKSSLLNAGLIPHSLRQGRAPERIRVYPESGKELFIEPINLQESDATEYSQNELPRYLPSRFITSTDATEGVRLSCEEFSKTLHDPSDLGAPLLIFDQFEELVTLFEENPQDKEHFEEAQAARIKIEQMLYELLVSDSIRLKLVFAFRDDYYARLTPFFSRIPNLTDQTVRLALPGIELLHHIVRGPFLPSEERGLPAGHFRNKLGEPDELSEKLADKIESGIRTDQPSGVLNLSEVQTLCLVLWRQPERRSQLLGSDNPAAVLQEIIESTAVDSLKKLLPWDRVRALALLANLVTQEGTRNVVSEQNLISETRRNPLMWLIPGDWRKLLSDLPKKTGLLRRSLSSGTTYYELTSEFLISWIQRRQRAFRTLALIVSGLISVVSLAILAVLAVLYIQLKSQKQVAQNERKKAETQTEVARKNLAAANQSAAVATSLKISWRGSNQARTKLDLALLLSNQALRKAQATFEARNALLTCLLSSPQLSTFLRGHKKTAFCLAFSPDGNNLASAGAEGNIILWNPSTGYMTQAPYKAHERYIYSIAFSPDGKSLASASEDHTVKVWNVKTAKPELVASLAHPEAVHAVAFSPDGTRLASAGTDHIVRIWDVRTLKDPKLLQGHNEAVHTVSFSADNKWLASAGDDNKIILWDAKTFKMKGSIPLAEKKDFPVCRVLFSRDSKSVLASSTNGAITKWDCATPEKKTPKRFDDHFQGVYGMDLSETQLASASVDGTVKLRSPEGGEIKVLTGYGEPAYSAAFSPNGNMLAAGFTDGVIAVWDLSQISPIVKRLDTEMNGIAVGPGGKTLAVAQGNSVVVWDVEQGKWLTPALTRNTTAVWCVAISPDGETLASGSGDETVRLWKIATGEQIGHSLRGHTDSVWSVAFSHDSKSLASGGGPNDSCVRIWNVSTHKCKTLTVKEQTSGVTSLSFSPDDKQLAAAFSDGTICRWNVETGKESERLKVAGGKVDRVAFGTQALACTNLTPGITLWDFSAKELQPRRLATKTAFSSIAFDRTGRTLLSISGGPDGSMTRWDVSSGKAFPNPPKGSLISPAFAEFCEFATHAAVTSGRKITVSTSTSSKPFGRSIDTGVGRVVRIESTYDGDMIVANASGSITLLDGKTFQPKGKPLQLAGDLADIASSPIANVLACASGEQVTVWDLKTNHQRQIHLEASATRVVYSLDGKTLATGDKKGNIQLWDAQSLKKSDLPLDAHKGPVTDLAFDPKRNVLRSIGEDNELISQPLIRGQPSIRGKEQNISRIAVSPDGMVIGYGADDGRLVLLDAISDQEIMPVVNQSGSGNGIETPPPINDLAFSRDGKLLASSSGRNVQLWDVENRQQLGPPLTGLSSELRAVKFTPDGKYLLTADEQGTLLRWAVKAEEWERLASSISGRQLAPNEWKQYMGTETYEPFPDALLAVKEADNAFLADEPREKVEQAFRAAVEAAAQSDDPEVNNTVCWDGSLRGFAPIVLPAGRRCFELATKSDEKNVGYYQDTLALALALTHNIPPAIENFKAFVKWAKDHGDYDDIVAKREEWIRKLEDGKDPFKAETLKELFSEAASLD